MNNPFEERISGLVDGELHNTDRAKAIDDLVADQSARQCWERYHLISDALKRNLPAAMDRSFAANVMAALKDEPTILAPTRRATSSAFTKRLAGLAVAASVAAIGVLGVQFMYQEDGLIQPQDQLAQFPVPQSSVIGSAVRPGVQLVQQGSLIPESMVQESIAQSTQRVPPNLSKYLVDHNQQTARGVQGVIPYARIVTYPASANTQH